MKNTWLNVQRGVMFVTAAMGISLILWVWLSRYLPKMPYFNRITVGGDHACGLTPLGEAWCWGDNVRWAQALKEQLDYTAPHKIQGGHRFVNLSGGWDHYCGVTITGQMVCWGFNKYGQLGDGTVTRRYVPIVVRAP